MILVICYAWLVICYAWLVFLQLTRDLFAIAKFLFHYTKAYVL